MNGVGHMCGSIWECTYNPTSRDVCRYTLGQAAKTCPCLVRREVRREEGDAWSI